MNKNVNRSNTSKESAICNRYTKINQNINMRDILQNILKNNNQETMR